MADATANQVTKETTDMSEQFTNIQKNTSLIKHCCDELAKKPTMTNRRTESLVHPLMLIVTELSSATIAHLNANDVMKRKALAMIVIRALDINNQHNVKILQGYQVASKLLLAYPSEQRTFVENAWQMTKCVIGGPVFAGSLFSKLLNIIRYVELWADQLQFDLWKEVQDTIDEL